MGGRSDSPASPDAMPGVQTYSMPLGLPHAEAVHRSVCGARRKNESAPCENPRDGCPRHCGRKNKQTGYVCSQYSLSNGACRQHGGKSLKGIEHPGFKHGATSRYTPRGNLVELYNEAYNRGSYTEGRDGIALTDGMINQVLSEREEAAGQIFRQLKEEREGVRRANASGEPQKAAGHLNAIFVLIDRGVAADKQRSEVVRLLDHRRKLVDSETRRLEREKQTLTLEQVMMRDAIILEVLKETLNDRELANVRVRLQKRLLG